MTEELCIFCKIANKKAPANIVYEDSAVVAFLDIRPLNKGHTLVIPRKHYAFIYEVPDEEVAQLYKIVKKVALAIKRGVNAAGITVAQQNEQAAGQEILHVHVHVIPRLAGQRLTRSDEAKEADKAGLDEVGEKLKQYL